MPQGLEREGGDRSDAGDQHVVAQGAEDLREQSAGLGAAQERGGGGGAGEGDRVQAPGGRDVEHPVERGDVPRRHPAVDGDDDDVGARGRQRLDEAGQRFAVQLEGDPAAGDAFGEEPVEDLGHRFGPGRPCLGQPGGPDGALDLGAPGEEFDPAQRLQQGVADPPAVGRLDPAPEADRGGGDRHVGGVADQLLGGGEEFAVVGELHDPQGGGVQNGGPAALEEGGELLGATGGGHPDGEAREGAVRCVVVLHGVSRLLWFPLVRDVRRPETVNDA